MDAISDIRQVAQRVAPSFPHWTHDDVVSELWLITQATGLPPHACWRRLYDAYAQQWSMMSRAGANHRRRLGRRVPQSLTGGAVPDRPDDGRSGIEEIEEREHARSILRKLQMTELEWMTWRLRSEGQSITKIEAAVGRTKSTLSVLCNRVAGRAVAVAA